MAEGKEEGTGKHPHKSTEELYPHHEAPTTRGKEGSQGKEESSSSSRGREEGERTRQAAAGAGREEQGGWRTPRVLGFERARVPRR